MLAGSLNEIIHVLEPQTTVTVYGELNTEYREKVVTRAKVVYNSGDRQDSNNEIFYNIQRTFEVRYYVNISEVDHITYNSKEYRILSILPDRQYQKKIITAELINE